MGPGTWSYVPAGVFHSFRVTSDQPGRAAGRLCAALRREPGAHDHRTRPRGRRRAAKSACWPPVRPPQRPVPLIDRDTVGAQWVEIEALRMAAGSALSCAAEAGRRAGALPRRRTHRCARRRAGLPSRARRLPVSSARGRRGPALPDGPAGVRLPHQGTASVLAFTLKGDTHDRKTAHPAHHLHRRPAAAACDAAGQAADRQHRADPAVQGHPRCPRHPHQAAAPGRGARRVGLHGRLAPGCSLPLHYHTGPAQV